MALEEEAVAQLEVVGRPPRCVYPCTMSKCQDLASLLSYFESLARLLGDTIVIR
jgi:hypothetical protein